MNLIKCIIKKVLYGKHSDSSAYIKHLKKRGISIGDRTTFFEPQTNRVDETRPCLVSIGNDVQITRGVIILTHDYAWSVIKGVYGDILGSAGSVNIGNNVFIGMNTIITKNCIIGDNVIIGANSLVKGNLKSDSVYAGVPAKRIMSLSDYYIKRRNEQLKEAQDLFFSYYNRFLKKPTKDVFSEFFFLFEDRSIPVIKCYEEKMELGDSYNLTNNAYLNKKELQLFESFEAFTEYCMKSIDTEV